MKVESVAVNINIKNEHEVFTLVNSCKLLTGVRIMPFSIQKSHTHSLSRFLCRQELLLPGWFCLPGLTCLDSHPAIFSQRSAQMNCARTLYWLEVETSTKPRLWKEKSPRYANSRHTDRHVFCSWITGLVTSQITFE